MTEGVGVDHPLAVIVRGVGDVWIDRQRLRGRSGYSAGGEAFVQVDPIARRLGSGVGVARARVGGIRLLKLETAVVHLPVDDVHRAIALHDEFNRIPTLVLVRA